MEDQLKSAMEEADKEKTLKEVAEVMARENSTVVENTEERARATKRAQALAEQKVANVVAKLEEAELKLAGAESLNSAKDKEIVELKAALEVNEYKWYNSGFTDAENSIEPVMFQSRRYGFGEGWMAALLAIGVPEDSPFKSLDQIPYPEPSPPVHNTTNAEDKETESMRDWCRRLILMLS